MKCYALLDQTISDGQWQSFEKEWKSFIKEHVGVIPVFTVSRQDYSDYPTTPDSDGDMRPTAAFLSSLTKQVDARVGDYGVDHIFVFVARDNWKSTGIWGTNFSYQFGNHHVHYCRWDTRNAANTFGTAYHEWMHGLDALTMTEIGLELDELFDRTKCWANWDSTIVHGNRNQDCKDTPYGYIRWKENTDALVMVAPHLRDAYAARRTKAQQTTLLGLLRRYLALLLAFKKDGVPRGT